MTTAPSYTIRAWAPDDLEQVVRLHNRCWSEEWSTTMDEARAREAARQPTEESLRLVAVDATGDVIAYAACEPELLGFPAPGRFGFELEVDPAHRGHGIARALYPLIDAYARERHAYELATLLNESVLHDAARILQTEGYLESERVERAHLDLPTPEGEPLAAPGGRPIPDGITIVDLASVDSPDTRHSLWNLHLQLVREVPWQTPPGDLTYEEWDQMFVSGPRALPEAFAIARLGSRYVAYSAAQRFATDALLAPVTALAREHRNRGLGSALLWRNVIYAKHHGMSRVVAHVHENNHAMLAVLRRFGFERMAPMLLYTRDL